MSLIRLGSTLRLDESSDEIVVACDYGSFCNAEVIITLAYGDCFQVCRNHIIPMIVSVATTDNPVHSIEEI